MGRFPLVFGRSRPLIITAVAVVLVAGAALTLAAAAQSAYISGHVYHCDSGWATPAARACAPGEPVAHTIVRFELADGSRYFSASTDAIGAYTVRLVPGTYTAKWEVVGSAKYGDAGRVYIGDWGLKPFTMRSGQHLILDLTSQSLTQ
jgi:hypothetical protein